jgi:signal transduction histidine kinase
MRSIRDISIQSKITLLVMATCSSALILAGILLIMYQQSALRESRIHQIISIAHVLGNNSTAALEFNDSRAGIEMLGALRSDSQITAASLLGQNGQSFAGYVRSDPAFEPSELFLVEKDHYQINGNYLVVYCPIYLTGAKIGTVIIKSSLQDLYSRLTNYAIIVAVIIIVAMLAAYMISFSLQRFLSAPLLHLARVARKISSNKNYSLRAKRYGGDEIGQVIDQFNAMLDQIERQESSLTRRTDELARSNKELERFAYIASHDLQAPLRMVASYADLLRIRYREQLDDQAQQYLDKTIEGASRMQTLINDLLAYSRVGRLDKEPETVNLDQVLQEVLQNLEPLIKQSDARISHCALPLVKGHRTQLLQVFQNILNNAIKFRGQEPLIVDIAARREGQFWVIRVSDNGIGIENKYLDKIFIIFQRLHNKSEYPGTGIGLAVCKRIIEFHGGRIWVESEPGIGSVFLFSLKAADSDSELTVRGDGQQEGILRGENLRGEEAE